MVPWRVNKSLVIGPVSRCRRASLLSTAYMRGILVEDSASIKLYAKVFSRQDFASVEHQYSTPSADINDPPSSRQSA